MRAVWLWIGALAGFHLLFPRKTSKAPFSGIRGFVLQDFECCRGDGPSPKVLSSRRRTARRRSRGGYAHGPTGRRRRSAFPAGPQAAINRSGHTPIERLANVDMKVSVVDLSTNQKKLQVEIPASNVQVEMEKKYRDLARQVRIKGFRPGKVPRSILKSYYGKAVEGEVSNELIQGTFPDALTQSAIKPLAEADVSEMRFEDDGAFSYEAIIDVPPPFTVDGYKGIEVKRPVIDASEEKIDAELERLREQQATLSDLGDERSIEEGDVLVVDYTPFVDGEAFQRGAGTDRMIEVGRKSIHPDFDGRLLGHKAGDSFSFEVEYPADATPAEIAGKTVRFEATIKSAKKKVLPELDDAFAKAAGKNESMDALRASIRERIEKSEEARATGEVRQQIRDQLLEKTPMELSPKVIERETEMMVTQFKHQFESQGLKIDTSKILTPEVHEEYRKEADKNIRWRLILDEIARLEDIAISDEELEEIYREVARLLRKDIDTIKSLYADSSIVEQLKSNKLQEKVLKLLEEEASSTEAEGAAE